MTMNTPVLRMIRCWFEGKHATPLTGVGWQNLQILTNISALSLNESRVRSASQELCPLQFNEMQTCTNTINWKAYTLGRYLALQQVSDGSCVPVENVWERLHSVLTWKKMTTRASDSPWFKTADDKMHAWFHRLYGSSLKSPRCPHKSYYISKYADFRDLSVSLSTVKHILS